MEPYVFISYSSQNYAQAQGIRNHLERSGLRCWMAPDSIKCSENFAAEIPQAIKNCHAFLLVLDQTAMHANFVERELINAIKQNKRIFPFMTEKLCLTESFELYLNTIQYYRAYQNFDRYLDQLAKDLSSLLGKPSSHRDQKPKASKEKMSPLQKLFSVAMRPPRHTENIRYYDSSWEKNVLMPDKQNYGTKNIMEQQEYSRHFKVFHSEYERCQIKRVYILDTLAEKPFNAWDVSLSGDGSVMAWVTPDGELYDLFLAAEGGICAPADCGFMFTGYNQTISFSFDGNFHTDHVRKMSNMFGYCSNLASFNMSEFNTAQVRDMSGMFIGNAAMQRISLNGVNTENVETMRAMFYGCVGLYEIDLRSFHTARVADMAFLFYNCEGLCDLAWGANFVTSAVKTMEYMFYRCLSLKSLDLCGMNTKKTMKMSYMFKYCRELESIQYGEDFVIPEAANTEEMYLGCTRLPDDQKLVH